MSWRRNSTESVVDKPTVALSTAESEYIAACECTKEALWFRQLLLELNMAQECTQVNEDNQAAIALSRNPQYHQRTKHIQVQYLSLDT